MYLMFNLEMIQEEFHFDHHLSQIQISFNEKRRKKELKWSNPNLFRMDVAVFEVDIGY